MLIMMKSRYKQFFALLASILFSIIMPAQEIPVLPSDPSVVKGSLPNGMSYYLVPYSAYKGIADFTLVQKAGTYVSDDTTGIAKRIAREALAYDPRLSGTTPQGFMASHGARPGINGFVEVREDATIYSFEGVRLSDRKDVLDSALLVLMDMTERVFRSEDEFLRKWYAPADQAIVVVGDINAAGVTEKLKMLSLMTPGMSSSKRRSYEWKNQERPFVERGGARGNGVSEVSLSWRSARPSKEYMNTVQPAMFDISMHVLGDIACNRLGKELNREGIPYADIAYDYVNASQTPEHESFSIKAYVSDKDIDRTMEIMTGVMASLDGAGASVNEYRVSRSGFLDRLHEFLTAPLYDLSKYSDRCVSAFLYNFSLASPKERLEFHQSRNLHDTTSLRLFNDIASALLDGSANIIIGCPSEMSRDMLLARTDSIWTADFASSVVRSAAPNLKDTVSFPGAVPKCKLKSTMKDHLSGGSVWTFANGFKVVYKKMPSSGRIYYNMALNGGFGGIGNLSAGEGAFISDYLDQCYVAGLKGSDFKNILMTEGVTMNVKVNLSNTMISGHAPNGKASLLMRSLLALANDRRPDPESFSYYMECQDMLLKHNEGTSLARMTAIDSIMCPGYIYSTYKSPGKLTEALAGKAEEFYSKQFEKMNDGVLVLVGDINEESLKKTLSGYVGGFRTKEVAFRRPVVKYQPVSGWSTYTADGIGNTIDVVMSARMPLTSANYAASVIAALIMEQKISETAAEEGMSTMVSCNFKIYPEERFNIIVSACKASEDGFAEGMAEKTPIEALAALRARLTGLKDVEIPAARLAACKAYLKNIMSLDMKHPDYWTDAIALRYLDGKDLTTGYAAKIDAVTADDVKAVFGLLEEGSKVEYIIMGQ